MASSFFKVKYKVKKLLSFLGIYQSVPASEVNAIEMIYYSGLFDEKWYLEENPDVDQSGVNALEHYYYNGYNEGRSPSYLFDPAWYIASNSDVKKSGMEPLYHYIKHGEKEGRQPSIFFCPKFYKEQADLGSDVSPLADFYTKAVSRVDNPISDFDVAYYQRENEDVVLSGMDAYKHFLQNGVFEGRKPNPHFDLTWYTQQYLNSDPSKNPFEHYLKQGKLLGYKTSGTNSQLNNPPTLPPSDSTVGQQEKDFLKKNAGFEDFSFGTRVTDPKVKLLAYYLPQFHPFEENDGWWGKGFTEWTNVTRGRPRFNGHYQPRLPRDLGFYDLRLKETLLAQAEMARNGGLEGFCFYHYWFNGRRLMDGPVNMLLNNPDIELPFCIMWANENWSRRWDGLDQDILIAQDYHDKDDEAFIEDLVRHFKDPRYIRIDGKPLFFIYRPGIVPNAKEKFAKWRFLLKEQYSLEIVFYMVQAFDDLDPRPYGLDGAIEFPPHKVAVGLPSVAQELGIIDADFVGHYPSYDAMVENSLQEIDFEYDVIKAVTPMWDNEARKPAKGMGFVGSTPKKYERWLSEVVRFSRENPVQGNHSFVGVNAWNEWAEGAYLEPDIHWGSAYLNATYRAVYDIEEIKDKYPILLIGHDAYRHGAQLLTLNIFKTLKRQFGCDVRLIILGEGPLVEEYQAIGETFVCHGDMNAFQMEVSRLKNELGFKRAICNTTVSGKCASILHDLGFSFISLIHELENLIKEYGLEQAVSDINQYAEKIIFAAKAVQDSFVKVANKKDTKNLIIHPQGIYQELSRDEDAYREVRKELGVSEDSKLVINVGYADLRKGFDLFVNTAKRLISQDPSYHFIWVGDVESNLAHWLKSDLDSELLVNNYHNISFTNKISRYLQAANVFAMTSREDPFPSVVMEALALGTPVVGFEGGGGFTELLDDEINGSLVGMADINAMADSIIYLSEIDSLANKKSRAEKATNRFKWDDYVFSLLQYIDPTLKKVSVAIPNYNYERHISNRMKSVFAQHYPVFEVIVLDDSSPDNSVEVIKHTADFYSRKITLIENTENSGSVFKQWKKGADIARGEFLWIAEADDLTMPEFLSAMLSNETDFVLAYADSKQIDENDQLLADDYRYYYDAGMMNYMDKSGVYSGLEIVDQCLSIKNQFMNVSSMLFNTQAVATSFSENLDNILEYKVAGDWFIYVTMLCKDEAKAKLVGESLSIHRRHSESVTKKNFDVQLSEIASVQEISFNFCQNESLKDMQAQYLQDVRKVLEA